MNIYINEKAYFENEGITLYELRNKVKRDADILIVNGFPVEENMKIKDNDRVTFIKRGEILQGNELEALMIARHTPCVHEKMKWTSVGIAGLGGLGSNVAISLARLGIGRLVLVDYDIVEPSNLNRQQYFIRHIGMKKTEALKDILAAINPFIKVEIIDAYLDESNIEQCFKDVEIVVEALDSANCKAVLVNTILSKMKDKKIVAASGMAGYFSNNTIKTKRVKHNFYLIGDDVSEAVQGCGLMAPRVAIAANHQANTVLRLIIGENEI